MHGTAHRTLAHTGGATVRSSGRSATNHLAERHPGVHAVGLFINALTPCHDRQPPLLLEYDGNTHTVLPRNKLQVLTCDLVPVNEGFAGLAFASD